MPRKNTKNKDTTKDFSSRTRTSTCHYLSVKDQDKDLSSKDQDKDNNSGSGIRTIIRNGLKS